MNIFGSLFKKKESKLDISSILPQEIFEAGVLELKDIIAPSALKVTPKEINLGEKILRSFFVISYPRFLSEGWFSPIINMDKVFDVGLYITIYGESDSELDKVESEIKSVLEAKLIYVKPALFQQEQGYKST